MSEASDRKSNRGPNLIGAYINAVIEPVCAKRGFATADLIAAWADIVGPRYAEATQPEKLAWPRRDHANAAKGATLVIRVDAGMAIYLQHETALILERVNGFLGFGAVAKLKIVQGPVAAPKPRQPAPRPISRAAEAAINHATATVESDGLRAALERLGRGVYAEVERS
ncbi:DciA family protein [Kaistia dalseonensis]|uniref:DUF721 domain-containing protein n=1 Tax=Kaistia dalseonensis TaxID=410840 RepID=A0ABU0HCS7_9HYPH|nr:DciA family protein [Kaistia dalseonensis]MCX5497481.1 DciA family protein [Kaistia dalseonensis]MDQ0440120.1 hypothetical protein [Kaistia dalseonensis]